MRSAEHRAWECFSAWLESVWITKVWPAFFCQNNWSNNCSELHYVGQPQVKSRVCSLAWICWMTNYDHWSLTSFFLLKIKEHCQRIHFELDLECFPYRPIRYLGSDYTGLHFSSAPKSLFVFLKPQKCLLKYWFGLLNSRMTRPD